MSVVLFCFALFLFVGLFVLFCFVLFLCDWEKTIFLWFLKQSQRRFFVQGSHINHFKAEAFICFRFFFLFFVGLVCDVLFCLVLCSLFLNISR